MDIGFIGLGAMGLPMARHLLAAGHCLRVWARNPARAAALPDAEVCATPAELAARCEVVFTMVTASADVAAIAHGEHGLLAGLGDGCIWIDCSTVAPDLARELGAACGARSVHFIDAPVSGGVAGAEAATLAVMAGGEAAVIERCRPLFACLGPRLVHIGPHGAGQVAKACNQMIMVAAIEAVAEAMLLAQAEGVDQARVWAALTGGSAASRVLDVMGERMVRRDFAAGVEARLHHKDFGIIAAAARAQGTPLPVAAAVGQQLNALMGQGWGHDDTAVLLRLLERQSWPM